MGKIAYICDYCGTIVSEDVIADHEAMCDNNPRNKTCLTCANCTRRNNYWLSGELIQCNIPGKGTEETYIQRNCINYLKGKPTVYKGC